MGEKGASEERTRVINGVLPRAIKKDLLVRELAKVLKVNWGGYPATRQVVKLGGVQSK